MDTQMKRGFLDACVLASLAQGESYGYQMIKDMPTSIGISESTLYPLLKRLETKKLIRVRKAEYNGRLRKYYSLAEAGRAFLEEFVDDKKEIDEIFAYVGKAVQPHAGAQEMKSRSLE